MQTTLAKNHRRTSIGAQRNPASQEAILQAAEEILVENGLSGFTIEAVARRAHAGKPTIYRWWKSRATLLLDVYRRQKYELPRTGGIAPDTGRLEDDVLQFLSGLFGYWRNGHAGAVFRSVIAEAQTDPDACQSLATYMDERFRQGAEMFSRAKARGLLQDWVDPLLAMELVSSLAWKRLLTDRIDPAEDELRITVRHIVCGLMRTNS